METFLFFICLFLSACGKDQKSKPVILDNPETRTITDIFNKQDTSGAPAPSSRKSRKARP
jgi:hypothetical protein